MIQEQIDTSQKRMSFAVSRLKNKLVAEDNLKEDEAESQQEDLASIYDSENNSNTKSTKMTKRAQKQQRKNQKKEGSSQDQLVKRLTELYRKIKKQEKKCSLERLKMDAEYFDVLEDYEIKDEASFETALVEIVTPPIRKPRAQQNKAMRLLDQSKLIHNKHRYAKLQIVNLLNADMTYEQKQVIAKLIEPVIEQNPNANLISQNFYLAKLIKDVKLCEKSSTSDIFKHAYKFATPDLVLEFLHRLWTTIQNNGYLSDSIPDFRKFINIYFKSSVNDNPVLWQNLSNQQLNVLINIQSVVKEQITDKQANILATACKTEDDMIRAFHLVFSKASFAQKALAIKIIFELTPEACELLAASFKELLDHKIIEIIRATTIDQEKLEVLREFIGVEKNSEYFNQIINWVEQQTLLMLLKQLLKSQKELSYHTLSETFEKLLELLGDDIKFEDHLEQQIPLVTNLSSLQSVIHSYVGSEKGLRDDVALEKVREFIMKFIDDNKLDIESKQFDEIVGAKVFQDLKKQYFQSREFNLHQWQLILAAFVGYAMSTLNMNLVVNLATGHGKSLILACLAKYLHDQFKDSKIIVVSLNNFLKSYQYNTYSFQDVSKSQGNTQKNLRIIYCSFKEFLDLRGQKKDKIVLFDEIDQLLTEKACYTTPCSTSQTYQFHYKPLILQGYKMICGFSGTITSDVLQILQSCKETGVSQLRIGSLIGQPDNNFKKVYPVKDEDERKEKVLEVVKKELLDQQKTCIVIDQNFSVQNTSFGLDLIKICPKYFKFQSWEQRNYDLYFEQLKIIRELSEPCIIHTNLEGARGVDYSTKVQTAVICAFDPTSYAELNQALGRGSRNYKTRVYGTLVTTLDNPTTKDSEFLNFFKNKYTSDEQDLSARIELCKKISGQEFKCQGPRKDKLLSIFNEKKPLHFADEEDTAAYENYKFVRDMFSSKVSIPSQSSALIDID